MEKTFSFMGGPQSQHEPLVDTTTSTFDSLFTIGEDPRRSIFVEEEVSSFDVGTLDDAIDEAAADVGVNTTLSESLLQGNELSTQNIDVQEEKGTGTFHSQGFSRTDPVAPPRNEEDTLQISFPTEEVPVPSSETFNVEGATFRSALLTEESQEDLNRIRYTLSNGGAGSTPLTDGEGGAPRIRLETGTGEIIAETTFPRPVSPGASESVTIRVPGARLGHETVVILEVKGGNPQDDTFTTDTTPFRYQEVTFGEIGSAAFQPDPTTVATRGTEEVRFGGVDVRGGTLQMRVRNNFSFPISIDELQLSNTAESQAPLPDDFPSLGISETTGTIQPGGEAELTVDLSGRGITDAVNLSLRGTSRQTGDELTVTSGATLQLSATGALNVQDLYFWPQGEQLQAGGTFNVETGRIQFEQSSDYIELNAGTLSLNDLVSEPEVGFSEFTVSFPDLRRSPYALSDSLVLRFTENPSGEYEFPSIGVEDAPRDETVDLSDVRLAAVGNQVDYHVQAQLETITNPNASNLRVVQFEDEVSTGISVGDLDIRAVKAGVSPFSVPVTDDANDDGRLDVADDAEAKVVSIDGFDDLAGPIDGLQLEGSRMTLSVETNAGADAQLYAALLGRRGDTPLSFLAGKGKQAVASSDSLGNDFYRGGTPIAAQDLIQFSIRGASSDNTVTRSIELTDENSSVDDFISTLPTTLRFAGEALLSGGDDGRIRLRRPLQFDAGLNVKVPFRFEGGFTVRDTIDADLSSLSEFTDPKEDVSVSTAEIEVGFTNQLPMGADLTFVVLNAEGAEVLRLPGEGESFQIDPAPKANDGTTGDARSGTITLNLTENEVRDLATGKRILIRLDIDQQEQGPPATVRTTDTITLSLQTKVEGTVRTGN